MYPWFLSYETMPTQWQGRTDGTPWMQRNLIESFRYFPLWCFYALVAIVVPFYLIFAKGYKASYRYFRLHHGFSPIKSFFYCYYQYFRFGQIMVDRFACYAGLSFRFSTVNFEEYTNLTLQPDAFVMLSAHVGSYELGGYFFVAEKKAFNMVLFGGETETIMKNREELFERTHIRMIPVREDLGHLFEMNEAIEKGEILSMAADRCNGSDRTVKADFFGAKARFPLGPFATVLQRNLPTLAVFVLKVGYTKYRVYVERLALPATELSRAERINSLAQSYAEALEKVLRKRPEQWFNFFDVWQ